jgi:hypothetical protein
VADGSLTDAAAGVRRCEIALGITPRSAGGAEGGKRGGGKVRVSEEDAKQISEVQARVKDVARQKMRAQEQARVAAAERKRAELTLAQVSALPEGTPT